MTRSAANLRIGLFVLAGLALLAAGLLALGLGWQFQPVTPAETYLDQSVQGLEVGAPVMELGVPVGRVAAIGFAGNEYPEAPPVANVAAGQRSVVVQMALDSQAFPARMPGAARRNYLERQVAQGLRAHLAPQGFTGELYLELDFVNPRQSPAPRVSRQTRAVYIPAVPGTLTKLTNAAEQVLGRLKDADVAHLVANATSLVNELRVTNKEAEALLADPDVGTTVANLAQASGDLDVVLAAAAHDAPPALAAAGDATRHLDRLAARLDRATSHVNLEGTAENFAATAADARQAAQALAPVLVQTRQTLQQLRLLLGYGSGNLAATISDLDQLAETLNGVAAGIKAYPSQLVFGQAPPHVSYQPGNRR